MVFMVRSIVARSSGVPLLQMSARRSLFHPSVLSCQNGFEQRARGDMMLANKQSTSTAMSSEAIMGYRRVMSTKSDSETTPRTTLGSNPAAASPGDDEKNKEATAPPVGRLRQAWNQYGWVAVGTYAGVYVGTLAGLTTLVSMDVIGAGGAIQLFRTLHIDSLIDLDLIDPKLGDFALAWVLTKVVEPLRLVVSLSITPTVANVVKPFLKKRAEEKAEAAEAAAENDENDENNNNNKGTPNK
jgi:hypothetical protein